MVCGACLKVVGVIGAVRFLNLRLNAFFRFHFTKRNA